MSDVLLCQGDAIRLPLKDACVQACICSPPYWNLRNYNVDGQLGLETLHDCNGAFTGQACGECYICHLRAVFKEVWRVLRHDGTLWINIADSYNAAGRTGHGTRIGCKQGTNRASAAGADACRPTAPGLKEKDLCGIPHRLALALQSDGWYWRSEIIWHKLNPMPESVTDRPTKTHEQVFLFSKQPRYFMDMEAIREPHQDRNVQNGIYQGGGVNRPGYIPETQGFNGSGIIMRNREYNSAGRACRSVWALASEPYDGAHFATFPTALVSRCILAGTPQACCCPQCRTPYQRQVDTTYTPSLKTRGISGRGTFAERGAGNKSGGWNDYPSLDKHVTTLGFAPACTCIPQALTDGCRDPQHMDWLTTPAPSLVLDPFSGSGTTILTARALGRHGVGVELSWEYLKLSRERLGLAALDRWQGTMDSTPVTTTYEGLPLFTAPEESA